MVAVVGSDTSDTMLRKQEFSNMEPLKHLFGHKEVVEHLPKPMALRVAKFRGKE